jgi:hypothetical protein
VHSWQLLWAGRAWALPTSQPVHEAAPEGLYEPAVQLAHGAVEFAENVPAGHATHFTPDIDTTAVPALPVTTKPSPQASHSAAWALLKLPAVQFAQEADPDADADVPASHGAQYACVGRSWYVPGSHGRQESSFKLAWYCPEPQSVQVHAADVLLTNLPGMQSAQ